MNGIRRMPWSVVGALCVLACTAGAAYREYTGGPARFSGSRRAAPGPGFMPQGDVRSAVSGADTATHEPQGPRRRTRRPAIMSPKASIPGGR